MCYTRLSLLSGERVERLQHLKSSSTSLGTLSDFQTNLRFLHRTVQADRALNNPLNGCTSPLSSLRRALSLLLSIARWTQLAHAVTTRTSHKSMGGFHVRSTPE